SFFTAFAEAGLEAAAVVPATVTVTVFEGPPRNDSVYVVVADGLICLVPRAATTPISGSIVMPDGFSVLHTRTTDSPGRTLLGRASNVTIRGSGPPPRPPRPA